MRSNLKEKYILKDFDNELYLYYKDFNNNELYYNFIIQTIISKCNRIVITI